MADSQPLEPLEASPEQAHRLRYETFRDLYFAERARRENIRASIGIPAAGLSFALYAFIALSVRLDLATASRHLPSMLMIGLASMAVLTLLGAVWRVLRAEWRFVYSEPPDLEEFLRLETEIHRQTPAASAGDLSRRVDTQTRDLLTAAYYLAYQRYVAGNTQSARHRTWSLRLVFVGILLLFLSALLLPVHLAAAGQGA